MTIEEISYLSEWAAAVSSNLLICGD